MFMNMVATTIPTCWTPMFQNHEPRMEIDRQVHTNSPQPLASGAWAGNASKPRAIMTAAAIMRNGVAPMKVRAVRRSWLVPGNHF